MKKAGRSEEHEKALEAISVEDVVIAVDRTKQNFYGAQN